MVEVKTLESDRLSTFRTAHRFMHYGEFTTVNEFREFRSFARERDLPILVLGNGSNVLFTRGRIRSLVLLNRLTQRG